MDTKFIPERITFFRIQKGVSEYKMSLDLGHSKGYIQSISSGKALPSVAELLYICEYLNVKPKDFFDDEVLNPRKINNLLDISKDLCSTDLDLLILMAKRLQNKK